MADGAKLVQAFAGKVQKLLAVSIFDHSNIKPPHDVRSNIAVHRWYEQQKAAELLLMSGIGKSFFEKQHKTLKEQCIELGMWDEDTLASLSPGAPVNLFNGAHVIVSCKVKAPRSRIDPKKLITELLRAGVKQDVLDKALLASEVTDAPAKSIEVVPL